jgi:hypothetical protein
MAQVHVLKSGYPKGRTGSSTSHSTSRHDFDARRKKNSGKSGKRVPRPANHPDFFFKNSGGVLKQLSALIFSLSAQNN